MFQKHWIIYTSLLCSSSIYATNLWMPVSTLHFGPQWTSPGQKNQISLQQNMTKIYDPSFETETLMGVGLFVGGQRASNNGSKLQLGATVDMTSLASVQGSIWEDADPNFNNYFYHYKVAPFRTLISGQWSFDAIHLFEPYLQAGLGVSFNRSYDYVITPKIFQELPAPPYTANTAVSFTYNVGAGIQKQLNKNTSLGLGYTFSDWGKSSLGPAFSQTTSQRLSLSHLYMNQLVMNLTYLFH